jgi:3-oxoacyl-[acyl-carrier-protein] synthase II
MSHVEHLTLSVQSIVDSVRPDLRRLVVLGAAQYSATPDDASANAGFAVPRDLTLLDPATGRPTRIPVLALSHACASVFYALDLARMVLRDPGVDLVIVASASVPNVAATESMAAVRALTSSQARPFADDRDGIILGSGGGAVCVQRARGADGDRRPGVLGRITAISTRVAGRSAASQSSAEVVAVLNQLHVTPDVVIAHATGTPTGDLVEIEAIDSWVGAQGLRAPVPVVSHKGASGHLLHASGLLGVAHALSLLGQSDVAGTAGLLQDIERDSSTVLAEGRHSAPTRMDVVVVSALGFGGNTAALAITSGASQRMPVLPVRT